MKAENSAFMETRTGGCLYGAARFSARGPLRGLVYCHCLQCRRQNAWKQFGFFAWDSYLFH